MNVFDELLQMEIMLDNFALFPFRPLEAKNALSQK